MKHDDVILLKRAIKYILSYKLKFLLAFLCILGKTGMGIAQPLLWGKILNNFFQKNIENALIDILFSLALSILINLISYFQAYIFASLNQNIVFDLKNDMYKTMLELPVKAYDDIDNGELMSRLHGDASEVANAITGTLINTLEDIIRLIAIGTAVFAISAKLALIIVSTFPICIYIFDKYGKKIRKCNKELSKINDEYYSESGQVIWGIREIKSLGIKKNKFDAFTKLSCKLKKMIVSVTLLNAKSQALSNITNSIAQMLITLVGGILVVKGELDIRYFIAFYSYSGQFSSSILSISRLNLNLQMVMNSLDRIFQLINGLTYDIEKFGEKIVENIAGNINLENVTFRYDKGPVTLDDVTINIPCNRKTAIVGSSGSGKTTIFNLILKLYTPNKGRILIDDVDLNEIKEDELRRHISVVRQEPVLFKMSIKENLLLAYESASQDEIESACKRAFIHEYIESLPEKYNSVIGENGINLSGGQRQRIAIARALLKKSKIILFDEATSSLDNESELYIKKAIEIISGECTVVIIAHRLSTIIEADIIYVMEKGKVVGAGNHQSLISTNSIYKKLYSKEGQLINDKSRR